MMVIKFKLDSSQIAIQMHYEIWVKNSYNSLVSKNA